MNRRMKFFLSAFFCLLICLSVAYAKPGMSKEGPTERPTPEKEESARYRLYNGEVALEAGKAVNLPDLGRLTVRLDDVQETLHAQINVEISVVRHRSVLESIVVPSQALPYLDLKGWLSGLGAKQDDVLLLEVYADRSDLRSTSGYSASAFGGTRKSFGVSHFHLLSPRQEPRP